MAAGAQRLATCRACADSERVSDRSDRLPEADLIRVQLEHQRVAIDYRNAEQDARRSVLLLFREMGIPEENDVRLAGELAAVAPLPGSTSGKRWNDVGRAAQCRP